MSVINKMLTDLERRQGSGEPAAVYVAPARGQGWWMLLLTLICGLALGILSWRSWLYWQQQQERSHLTAVVLPPVSLPSEQAPLPGSSVSELAPQIPLPPAEAQPAPGPSADASTQAVAQPAATTWAREASPDPLAQTQTDEGAELDEMDEPQWQEREPSDAELQPDLHAELAVEAAPEPAPRRAPSLKIETVELSPAEFAVLSERKANAALVKGELSEAEAQFSALLRQTPDNEQARQQLAGLLYGQGRLAEASALLEEGIRRQPDQADFRLLRARLALAEEDKRGALAWLGGARPPLASNLDYYATWAGLSQELGQNAEAAELYVRLLRVQPDQGRWWLGLGIAEDGQGHGERARDAYRNAQLHGNLGEASQAWLGQRLAKLGP
ncbi:tetratricopeptide repeat protein [Aeromonas bivalvium]|uniref:tetratricopeptide repeat protein n=1 Tax=Aeromonas bivalvium TaxID=440079 RepID=UPI00370A1069